MVSLKRVLKSLFLWAVKRQSGNACEYVVNSHREVHTACRAPVIPADELNS